jgi:hypothetical protein
MSSLLVVPKKTTEVSVQDDFLIDFGIYYNYISTFEGRLHSFIHYLTIKVCEYHFSNKTVEIELPKII